MQNYSARANSPRSNSPLACRHDPFCLGMCDWTECPCVLLTQPTNPTRPLLQESLPTNSLQESALLDEQPSTSKRFKFATEDKLAEMAKGFTPQNTSKATKWSLKVLEQWKTARNQQYPNETVPEDLLKSSDPQFLNTHLSRFAVEVRKVNGDKYPPSTIHQLLCGLLRHMRDTNPGCPNFLDKQDSRFKPLQGTLDFLHRSRYTDQEVQNDVSASKHPRKENKPQFAGNWSYSALREWCSRKNNTRAYRASFTRSTPCVRANQQHTAPSCVIGPVCPISLILCCKTALEH